MQSVCRRSEGRSGPWPPRGPEAWGRGRRTHPEVRSSHFSGAKGAVDKRGILKWSAVWQHPQVCHVTWVFAEVESI